LTITERSLAVGGGFDSIADSHQVFLLKCASEEKPALPLLPYH
jgi:hypothetical protein